MMTILDQLAARQPHGWFRPTSARELFLLRLAQKLGEPAAAEHYTVLAAGNSDATLLLAYRRTLNDGHPPRDLGRRFHVELASAKQQEDRAQTDRLLAIKI